jgi:predicted RNA-binding Zn ribbon-like protein
MGGDPRPTEDTEAKSQAPGELELVRSFVNTRDIESNTDALGTTEDAAAWLSSQGFAVPARTSVDDVRLLVLLREAIRDLVDHRPDADAAATINRIAADHPVRLYLRPDRELPLAPVGVGVDAAVERVLAILAASLIDGSWDRLKVCPGDRCRWLFYDHSRNLSRRWCSMDICGSRAKMRTYRRRQVGVPDG